MKVYLCMQSDNPCCGSHSWVVDAFKNEADAEAFCEVQGQLDEMNSYYVNEIDVKESYEKTEVRPYYSYYIGFDEDYTDVTKAPYWLLKDAAVEGGHFTEEDINKMERELVETSIYGIRSYDKVIDKILSVLTEKDKKEILYYMNDPEHLYDNDDEPENRVYTEDLVIEKTDDYIEVYSVNSFEEAKKTALELYKKEKK